MNRVKMQERIAVAEATVENRMEKGLLKTTFRLWQRCPEVKNSRDYSQCEPTTCYPIQSTLIDLQFNDGEIRHTGLKRLAPPSTVGAPPGDPQDRSYLNLHDAMHDTLCAVD